MKRYRFVGSYMEFGDRSFSRFGQWVDWDESFYRSIVQREPFLPEEEFKKLELTDDELSRYAEYANRPLAPESFNAKVKKAHEILHEIRLRVDQPYEVLEETPDEPDLADEVDPAEPDLADEVDPESK